MKLLATDYDGTLKFADGVLPADMAAIRQWRKDGNLFAIVTGRSKESITKEMEENDIQVDFLVTNNGGMVFDANDNILLSSTLDTITAIDLMYISHEQPDVVSYMVNDGISRHKVEVHPHLQDHRYPNAHPDWTEEEVMDSGRFAQIVFSCSRPEAALDLAEQINHYFGETVTAYANNFVVDIVPKGISKATGLEFVQSYNDVKDEDVFAIGDSHNDVPMLENVDNAACVVMAPSEVRDVVSREFANVGDYIHFIEKQ